MPELRVLSPRLPAATRARLRVEARVDRVGYWLASRGAPGVARRLWRAFHMLG
ncbi:hypothetical protein [Streptomyces sp. NPDC059597]|uniref:hypothetical protein n=1 Tax=Streptomyces sp. NPDC059597 TaxID=3346879 RepID=UPI0036A7D90B